MKKTAEWETTTGKKVTVTAELILSETVNLDGHKIDVKCCKKTLDVYVEGVGSQGGYIRKISPRVLSGLNVAHVVGKLVLTQEQVEIIRALEKEITDTPAWTDKIEKEKMAIEVDTQYEAHRAKMYKVMGY